MEIPEQYTTSAGGTRLAPSFRAISRRDKGGRAQFLAALVQSADDGIISKDLQGNVVSWNPSAERIFGYTEAEMLGQPITRLIPDELVWQEEAILRRIRNGEQVQRFEAIRLTRSGKPIAVSLTISPIRDGRGRIIGASKIVRDITAQKALERRVEVAKDEFLSNVSHELRTPLTGICAALRLLTRAGVGDGSDPRTASLLRIANANAERLTRLVNDLLDFERLTSGTAALQLRSCRLLDITEPALESISATAAEQGILLASEIEGGIAEQPLLADLDRMQQVLLNLLSNALKFSPAGSTVTLAAHSEGDSVVLRVRDEGRGIPAEKLESIFERFRQVDTSDTRLKGGVGLGLAICRKILEQHNGSIWAERNDAAEPGKAGTTFSLRLPMLAVGAAEVAA